MDTSAAPRYRGYRFPVEIIFHGVWLYFRFCLSFRDVQEMMLERGVVMSHEANWPWCLKFGAAYARRLRHRRGRCWNHLMWACHYRNKMMKQFETWRDICGLDQPAIVDHRLISA